jgi:hypothetical protein
MVDDPQIPEFNRAAVARVRRRIYVAMIMAAATFLVGLMYWPIRTQQIRVVSEITLEVAPPAAGAVLGQDLAAREARLQKMVRDCLSDGVLGEVVRRSQRPESSPAGASGTWETSHVRPYLQVGLTRDGSADSPRRWIQVIWSGPAAPPAANLVDLLTQEIASRVAREIRVEGIQLRLEERFDQIAQQQRGTESELAAVLRAAAAQLEQQNLTLLAWQQQATEVGKSSRPAAAERELQELKSKILNADAQLLTLLRQQVIHHFEVDESDGLVQHLERLIADREAMVAQWSGAGQSPQVQSVGGRSVPARMATHVAPTPGASNMQLDDADRRVRANPFFAAAAPLQQPLATEGGEAEVSQILAEVQLGTVAAQLQQALALLRPAQSPSAGVMNLAAHLRREPTLYRVIQVTPARTEAPRDVAPNRQWAFGLALLSLMLGAAFTLQHSPESLVQAIFRPMQLADYLGIDHLGTLRTAKPPANRLDQIVRLLGRRVFQAAEAIVLVSLAVIVIAMIWDPTLTQALVSDPLGGICRAFWTLMRT